MGSYLWTAIDPGYYSERKVGATGPGWELVPEFQGPLRWSTVHFPSLELSTCPEEANKQGWEILCLADLPDVTQTLCREAEANLACADSSQRTVLQMNPASPGILTKVHEENEYCEHSEHTLCKWKLDAEPIGLRKGETTTLLTRWVFGRANCILVTHLHKLQVEDVPTWTGVLDILASKTGADQVLIRNMDPDCDVSKAIVSTRDASFDRLYCGIGKPAPLMMVYYEGISLEDRGTILDTQEQMWP